MHTNTNVVQNKKTYKTIIYNIRYGGGTGLQYHSPFPFAGCLKKTDSLFFEKLSDWLVSKNPDIVCLVETDDGSFRQRGYSQPDVLSKKMSKKSNKQYEYFFDCKYAPNSPLRKYELLNKQGNSIISHKRYSANSQFLSRGIKNMVIKASFDDFDLYLVHFSLGYSARQVQIKELSAISNNVDRPCVIAGDGNMFSGKSECFPFFEKGFELLDAGNTWPSKKPFAELDFVVFNNKIRPIQSEVPDILLSDHLPVIFEFEII